MNKSQLFKVEDWTPEEAGLLDEMKSRCLNKGQYIDEKAKDKFKMLCHLEDYGLQYYEQQKEIERLNKEKDDLDDCNRHLYNENKRLNNIISELEKHCEVMLSIFEKMTDEQRQEQLDKYKIYDCFLSRLQKLKEGK